ncbi:MAG: hypothetical protein ACRET8_07750 [Burkholderiales bacterium]
MNGAYSSRERRQRTTKRYKTARGTKVTPRGNTSIRADSANPLSVQEIRGWHADCGQACIRHTQAGAFSIA